MRPVYSKMTRKDDKISATGFKNLHVFWCTKDYDEDHIQVLLEREVKRMEFQFQSPQIGERGKLVNWMKAIAAKKNLDNLSIHLAVYLLDVFMDNYNIVAEKLQLIALVCLLLATKFEERDSNVLKTSEVNELVNNKYTISDFFGLEILILKHLKWNLLHPTSVHFVQTYIEFLFMDDHLEETTFMNETELWLEAREAIKNYMDFVMEDIRLMHEKPSKVGAAIMAIARALLGFPDIWPERMNLVTGYKLFELKPIIFRLRLIANSTSKK